MTDVARENDERFHIAILDDDQDFREDLEDYFESEGYRVSSTSCGKKLDVILQENCPDLVIVDILLKGENGIEIAAHISEKSKIGILLLSNMTDAEVQVTGLEVGADAFLSKKTELEVIRATVHAIIRRIGQRTRLDEDIQKGWALNKSAWQLISPDGIEIDLNENERFILSSLFKDKGEPKSRTELLGLINKADTIENHRYLDVIIQRLRKKIKDKCKKSAPIKGVYGKGYAFLQG